MLYKLLTVCRQSFLLYLKYTLMAEIIIVHFAVCHPLGLCLYVFCLTAFFGMRSSEPASLLQLFCALVYLSVTVGAFSLWLACNLSVSRRFLDSILPDGFIKKYMGNPGGKILIRVISLAVGGTVLESGSKYADSLIIRSHADAHEQAFERQFPAPDRQIADKPQLDKAIQVHDKRVAEFWAVNSKMRQEMPKGLLDKSWAHANQSLRNANWGKLIQAGGDVLGAKPK